MDIVAAEGNRRTEAPAADSPGVDCDSLGRDSMTSQRLLCGVDKRVEGCAGESLLGVWTTGVVVSISGGLASIYLAFLGAGKQRLGGPRSSDAVTWRRGREAELRNLE